MPVTRSCSLRLFQGHENPYPLPVPSGQRIGAAAPKDVS